MRESEKLVPRRRFNEFINGDGWERRNLSEISLLITKGTTPLDKSGTGSVNFVKIENINSSSGEITSTAKISIEEHEGYLKRSQLKQNDILFSIAGTLGLVSTVKSNILPANTNQALAILRIKEGDIGYLVTVLKGKIVSDYIRKYPTIGAQPNLSLQQVGALKIPYPKLSEQHKIGEYFLNLDNLIAIHQRKLEKIKALKSAYLSEMFPVEGECKPKRRFAGFTEDWEQCNLGKLVNVHSGKDYKHLLEGPVPVYGTGGYMLSVNEALSYDEDAIGIGRKGTIDKPYILKAPFWTVDTLFYAIPIQKSDLNFLFYIFYNIDWKKKDESTGVPSLSKIVINEVNVLIPKYDEQKKIGIFFVRIDNLIATHQRKIEKLQNIKKAFLNEMFI